MKSYRMPEPCDNCPFNKTGPGDHLRRSLQPGRWEEITDSLERGETFNCHKTTDETGNGTNLVCAGAIEYQDSIGVSSQYVRICKRLEYFAAKRAEKGRPPCISATAEDSKGEAIMATSGERITIEDGADKEAWVCLCGNTPTASGFAPCNSQGEEVEPTEDGIWDGIHCVCCDCGRIIHQHTLNVIGRKAS